MSGRRRFLVAAGTTMLGSPAVTADRVAIGEHDRHGTTIGFIGDTMLGRGVDERYGRSGADPAAVWGDLRSRLRSLDGVCCNLECCLSTRGDRYPDRTYYFRADPEWAVPALEAGNVRFASLANNHMLDFGPTALMDTLDVLDDGGITHAGAGERPDDARAPSIVSIGDLDVAVVSFSDQSAEYAATEDRAGTAYVECDSTNPETRQIVTTALERASARDPDLLVASLHWGPNWVEVPDETYREFGRWLIEEGVAIVHGHSAHVVQGIEPYEGGVILHDTGDFVDDYTVKEELWNDRSFLFEVEIDDGDPTAVRLVPVVIDDEAVRRADPWEAAWLRKTIAERSAPFDPSFEYDDQEVIVPL
ncbi:CapA family protein [Natrinema sp. 1APR25-10V2]|uniref:CapA family protein n=1 Tax=Natrinema sp. 1APR25-10V2 TaxID=2951081 RepID=UPI0028760D78|nr:CapA family protein [Natrinema sp. 1APR25-10V2]MDS0476091.1 CapA family protein [Natrinema sp. 1APR25-10V2]